MRSPLSLLGFSLALAGNLLAQQTDVETQRASLTGLRNFAVYARVQLSDAATLERVDESSLRTRIELAIQEAGISVVRERDVRDGAEASLSLLYLVVETRNGNGRQTGFAASSCLQAAQLVRIPRLTTPKRFVYTVVPTWRSCGLLVGSGEAYTSTILRNADEQIAKFLEAWRTVNAPPPASPSPTTPELGFSVELPADRCRLSAHRLPLAAFMPRLHPPQQLHRVHH